MVLIAKAPCKVCNAIECIGCILNNHRKEAQVRCENKDCFANSSLDGCELFLDEYCKASTSYKMKNYSFDIRILGNDGYVMDGELMRCAEAARVADLPEDIKKELEELRYLVIGKTHKGDSKQ